MKIVKIQDVMVGQRFKINNVWFTMLDKATNVCISDIIDECKFITYHIKDIYNRVGLYKNQAPNDYNGSLVERIINDYTKTSFDQYSVFEPHKVDLWDTVNNEEYGTYDSCFSALSLVGYEVYREYILNTDKEWWLCTPLISRSIHNNIEYDLPFLRKVWAVDKDGVPVVKDVNDVCGVRFCAYLTCDTLCIVNEDGKKCPLYGGMCTKGKCVLFKDGKCCATDFVQELAKKLSNYL